MISARATVAAWFWTPSTSSQIENAIPPIRKSCAMWRPTNTLASSR